MHKKRKQATGIHKSWVTSKLRDQLETIITDKNEEITIWTTYINKVEKVISQLKDGKASGPGTTHAKFINQFDREAIQLLTTICNNIYSSGVISSSWLTPRFSTIPKNLNSKL